jgi:hypothetical protein
VDAAEEDDFGLGGLGLVAEAEGIADEIGDALDVLVLVVVSEDDGVALFFKGEDLLLDGGERGKLGARREDEGFVVEDGGHGREEGVGGAGKLIELIELVERTAGGGVEEVDHRLPRWAQMA